MITNFTEAELNKVNVPVVETTKHKARLRRALLAAPHWDGRSSRVKYTRLALSGLVVAVLAIAIFTNATKIGIKSVSPLAYAKGIAKKGIRAVAQLPTDEQKALEQRIHADAEGILKEALNARDLRVLTYAQIEKLLPNQGAEGNQLDMLLEMLKGTINEAPAALKQAKFLLFTGPEGGQVIIGFDEDNLPLIIKKAVSRFDETPSELAPGLVKDGDNFETVDGSVRGRTTIFADTEYDPGPKRVVAWFRVQDTDSGLKPVWDHKDSWLGPPEKKTVRINGEPVTIDYNVDAGMFEGKPFREIWIKGSWTKDGKEYQMHSINITVDDYAKMANSVK